MLIRPTEVEFKLLVVVEHTELSGDELAEQYAERTFFNDATSLSQIFPTVRRLIQRGWLRQRRQMAIDGSANYYAATKRGVKIIAEMRRYYAALSTFGMEVAVDG